MSIKTMIKEHFANNHLKGNLSKNHFIDHFAGNSLKVHFTSSYLEDHWENNSLKNYGDSLGTYFSQNNLENAVLENFNNENDLVFRTFTYEDLDGCAELFKNVFSKDPWYDDWRSLNQARNYLNELTRNPVFEGFLVQENSKIIAVCMGRRRSWWMGKEFFVDEFFVNNNRQGNGIGSKLMDFVTESLLEDGYTRLVLLTNKEIPAETFYLKNGFYNNQKRTVMVKKL